MFPIRLSRLAPVLILAMALGAAWSAAPALATDIGEMTEQERMAFRAEVRAYLLENPEVLAEAIDVLNQREAQAAAASDVALIQAHAEALFDDPAAWVGGNPEGDVTVVEFTDYRCGYCRRAHDEVAELVASDGNIRFIVKEFPILGEASAQSARFAIAVLRLGGTDAYAQAHKALITMRGDPTAEALDRLASDLGLDAKAVLAEMTSAEVTGVIANNHDLAARLQISGTPTFIVNGTMVRGYVPLDGMRQIVAEQRG